MTSKSFMTISIDKDDHNWIKKNIGVNEIKKIYPYARDKYSYALAVKFLVEYYKGKIK